MKRVLVSLKSLRVIAGAAALSSLMALSAMAQNPPFPGFQPGNLVVSRTVYSGDTFSVTVGQSLPPVCPSTASCGSAKATDSGAYPIAGSTNSVWNNNKVDGSFGITSPIFLDQITPTGMLVNTLPVPTSLVTTSFSSKSELAVNISTTGNSLTFMAYIAPPNAVDVSNSNTPGVYDPTNPVGTSYFRGVAEVSASGAIKITPTNAYSGNNGRAAFLAGGQYYLVGNSNNGGGTPTNVITATGAQIATPGQTAATVPQQIGNFSITQVNDPATGKPYAADKLGKDNNFRGLTIFNNTMYVTKGSGGNGINTVYQVGTAGTLPTLANAATAPITVLPGFPTTLAKNSDAQFPFGIWFANATTLYVADEGDGTIANAATSTTSGLQKWVLVNGTWQRSYVMQNGLNLGTQYSVANYPSALFPSTDGIRNITGKVNSDGTVTIYGVTSTVSANGDQGADPNLLVAITDTLAATTLPAGQQFTVLKKAAYGEVLRGVSLTPVAGVTGAGNIPYVASAATVGTMAIAVGSVASANGPNLSTGTSAITTLPLPTMVNGTSVSILDSAGNTWVAPLLYVSPQGINFTVPPTVAPGLASVSVLSGSQTQTAGNVQVSAVAPGLYTLNGTDLAAGDVVRVGPNGIQAPGQIYAVTSAGSYVANPIQLGAAGDHTYLTLFGTGFMSAPAGSVKVTIGGMDAPVLYAGPQKGYAGLDQVNFEIPRALAGIGSVSILLSAGGIASNPVQVVIQ